MIWLWWVGAALALGTLEMLSLALVLAMLAGGALVGGVAAALGAPPVVQVLLACVTAVFLLVLVRPYLLRHLSRRVPLAETNARALVGQQARVTEPVTATGGVVRLQGVMWAARTDSGGPLVAGEDAIVVRIEGATAVVAPAPGYGTAVHDEH